MKSRINNTKQKTLGHRPRSVTTCFTVVSDTDVQQPWQAWVLVVPDCSWTTTSFLSSGCNNLHLLLDLGKMLINPTNLSLPTIAGADYFEIFSCSSMSQRDLGNLCRSTVLLLRSSLRSLDFPIVLTIGQIIHHADKEKLPVVVNHNH